MARHYNISLGQWLLRLFRFKGGDFPTDEVSPIIQPVVSIRPVLNYVKSNSGTTSGNITIATTPSDKDIYLTGMYYNYVKDGANDNQSITVTAVINGATTTLLGITNFSLTARADSNYIPFPDDIKIDRNTNIILTGSFTVGNLYRGVVIYGYTSETLVSSTA